MSKLFQLFCIKEIIAEDDRDECEKQDLNCDDNAFCTQHDNGKWDCRCNRGYTGNGVSCQQRNDTTDNSREQPTDAGDECLQDGMICHEKAHCLTYENRHGCRCNRGYKGNGYTCEGEQMFCLKLLLGPEMYWRNRESASRRLLK